MPTGHDHGEGNEKCGEGSDPAPVNQGVGDSQAGEEQHPEDEVHPHQPSDAVEEGVGRTAGEGPQVVQKDGEQDPSLTGDGCRPSQVPAAQGKRARNTTASSASATPVTAR